MKDSRFRHELKILDAQIRSLVFDDGKYSFIEIQEVTINLLYLKKPTSILANIARLSDKYATMLFETLKTGKNDILDIIRESVCHANRIVALYDKIFYRVLHESGTEYERRGLVFENTVLRQPITDKITELYESNKKLVINKVMFRMNNRASSKDEDEHLRLFLVGIKGLYFFNDINNLMKEELLKSYNETLLLFKGDIVKHIERIQEFVTGEKKYRCLEFILLESEILGFIFSGTVEWDLLIFKDKQRLASLLALYYKTKNHDGVIENLNNWFCHFESFIDAGNVIFVFVFILNSLEHVREQLYENTAIGLHTDRKLSEIFYRHDRAVIEQLNIFIHEYMLKKPDTIRILMNIEKSGCRNPAMVSDYEDFLMRYKGYFTSKATKPKEVPPFDIDFGFMAYLYAYISSKFEFCTIYNNLLTKRLLSHRSDAELESFIVSIFKKKATKVLFYKTDVIIKEYQSGINFNGNFIYFLDKFRWSDSDEYKFDVNDEIKQIENNFASICTQKENIHNNYNWRHDLTACEVEIDNKHLVISLIQYEIIRMVVVSGRTKDEVVDRFNNYPYLDQHLRLLIDSSIIIQENDMYHFGSVSRALETNLIPILKTEDIKSGHGREENQICDAIENIYTIDAKIMSIIKKAKKVQIKKLIEGIRDEFDMEADRIDERLKNLTEKNFIACDKHHVTYIP